MPTHDALIYRPFEDQDFPTVAELFRRQWCGELELRRGRLASQATVCNYLMDAEGGIVAERTGEVLGVSLVSCGLQSADARNAWRTRRDALLAQWGPDARFGREIGPVEAEEGELSRRYAARRGVGAGAEIKLLIVSPAAQGLGVGRTLVEKSTQRVRSASRHGFFLITDDTCDVGFYDHLGLTRQVEEPSQVEPGISLYVYSKELG